MGSNLQIIDLRKAYLQFHVDSSLWRYQVVEYKGRRYCLTRLGFGLNVAPKIMTLVLNKVLSMDPVVRSGTDSFIDDIIVNNDIVSCDRVLELLHEYGLEAKPPENLAGGRVLGLRVVIDAGAFTWKRDNELQQLPDCATKPQLLTWLGQGIGHFPVG